MSVDTSAAKQQCEEMKAPVSYWCLRASGRVDPYRNPYIILIYTPVIVLVGFSKTVHGLHYSSPQSVLHDDLDMLRLHTAVHHWASFENLSYPLCIIYPYCSDLL